MSLESLNRCIKKEKLKGNGNIRVEKLLKVLEEVVDDKMWKRIITIKRPHRNTYQGRAVAKAHRKAELLKNHVEEKGYGHFIIKTTDKYYNITYKDVCMLNKCREMFCEACEVCFHKYRCECVKYLVKSTTCKHVHAVALYERGQRLQFIIGHEEQEETSNNNIAQIDDVDIQEFIKEKDTISSTTDIDLVEKRALITEQASNYMNQMFNLDDKAFEIFSKNFQLFINQNNKDLNIISTKRKLEK
ncbi:hypothetical protein ABEB36_015402 [Hypothenemus hampei]|uniref:SWIM-type domain-containing protein n=1 Tax=Hypothenemus hampei TaxID=57062 RepID=A0ABD1E2U4_HYPHA